MRNWAISRTRSQRRSRAGRTVPTARPGAAPAKRRTDEQERREPHVRLTASDRETDGPTSCHGRRDGIDQQRFASPTAPSTEQRNPNSELGTGRDDSVANRAVEIAHSRLPRSLTRAYPDVRRETRGAVLSESRACVRSRQGRAGRRSRDHPSKWSSPGRRSRDHPSKRSSPGPRSRNHPSKRSSRRPIRLTRTVDPSWPITATGSGMPAVRIAITMIAIAPNAMAKLTYRVRRVSLLSANA